MLTAAARRIRTADLGTFNGVATRDDLMLAGVSAHRIRAQLAAGRWQLCGTAVVLHNTNLTSAQCRRATLINCGPRAVLTSFTAVEEWGLRGWERGPVHVLAPAGTARPRIRGLILHRTGDWSKADLAPIRRLHRLAPAAVIAASSFVSPRSGCGILAACVQQRLARPDELRRAVVAATRTRHRRILLAALDDIAQGAEALSEIDFARLCRRNGLPTPIRQTIRVEPGGRRRYLDVEWRLADGRRVSVEVDGAFHLIVEQWIDDQLRQNEIVLDGTLVLRFPSVMVRCEPQLVISQLRRALR